MPTPKEQIYDTQINPLVDQILAICKEHNIATIMDFALGYEEGDDQSQLKCLSTFLTDECDPSTDMYAAARILGPRR